MRRSVADRVCLEARRGWFDPFSFTVNYLAVGIGARIRANELYSVPLLKILRSDLRIPIVRAQETIEAVPADPEVAQRLGLTVLYPVMRMRRVMFTSGNRPFEVVETFYRADKYHYSVSLVRGNARASGRGRRTWKHPRSPLILPANGCRH